MKILILGPPLDTIGGIQNYLNIFINKLKTYDNDVYYFPQAFKRKMGYFFYFNFVIQYFKFKVSIRKMKPDIIQLNPSLIWASIIRDFLFLNISKMNQIPVVFFIRGWRWQLFYRIRGNTILRKIFLIHLRKADKIIVLSRDFKEALVDLGIDKNDIFISSTMVESHLYSPKEKNFNKPYIILFCGQIAKIKGVYELIQSVPQVLEYEKNFKLILIGDGPELDNLKKKIKEMRIEEHISFTGYKSGKEKYDIFKNSHIFVLPSYTEGFPNVVLEAMAAGMPIIATPVGGLKYAIRNSENGFLCESNPPHSSNISNLILKLIMDPSLMADISNFNIKEVEKKYDSSVVTKEIQQIFNDIV